MRYDTETDRLARSMGYAIRRKRDGTFELIRGNDAYSEPTTMANIKAKLGRWHKARASRQPASDATVQP